ncbi:lysoplasmalogenase [Longimicrobium sp.]|uniref:lysoplasmalogenase n=1 Tax=Longimicrobium sp. TaxID=2029185 RepID=UPI002E363908|nr:lysoplasmalogenase [Longimicrobium sp.]HEX6038292.1 lysoplasmalogenase [Longimicrobium sp.]
MPILPLLLTVAIAVCAALTLRAEQRGIRRLVYVFKPLTTVLTGVLALSAADAVSGRYQALICAGLLFSLAGDVFLMLPRDRFVAGLASFLVAHGFYIAAFTPRPMTLHAPGALLVLVLVGIGLLRALWDGLGTLRGPVIVYAAALLVMAWQAAERWAGLGTTPALLAAVGAGLFVVSDSVLAWQRFVARYRWGQPVVLSTYFAAQWLIALSVASRPFG